MNNSSCTDAAIGSQIWRYELNDLKPDERARFEKHLMDCDVCLNEVLRMMPAIRALRLNRPEVLTRLEASGITYEGARDEILDASEAQRKNSVSYHLSRLLHQLRVWRRPWVIAPAMALAVISILLVVLWHQPHDRYVSLLEFDPLFYERQGPRGMITQGVSAEFTKGMDAYYTGNYSTAVSLLSQAVSRDSTDLTAWLYLGVSDYLLKNAPGAISTLRRVVSSQDRGTYSDAQWYLAQAFLLNNQPDSAWQRLEDVERTSPWSPKADLLRVKLKKLRDRR
jgi:tetratricopeptide (TPR) repeat protein